jgi:hypothetical protein
MATVYMSLDPFFGAFKEEINLQKWPFDRHRTAGISVVEHHGCLYVGNMVLGSPGTKVDKWRLHVRGAWLIQVGDTTISTMADAESTFKQLYDSGAPTVTLLLSHPELHWDISHNGLLIISTALFTQLTHNQLNHHWNFATVVDSLRKTSQYKVVDCGDVLNYVTRVMQLTRGKLLHQIDWKDWQALEFLQLDQYDAQKTFGPPVAVDSRDAVFNLVWSLS